MNKLNKVLKLSFPLQRGANGDAEVSDVWAEVWQLDEFPAEDGGRSGCWHRRLLRRPQAAAMHTQGGETPPPPPPFKEDPIINQMKEILTGLCVPAVPGRPPHRSPDSTLCHCWSSSSAAERTGGGQVRWFIRGKRFSFKPRQVFQILGFRRKVQQTDS